LAKLTVRHLRTKRLKDGRRAWFFEATPALRAAGIHSEALGTDRAAAIARAEALNADWDRARGEERGTRDRETTSGRHPHGTFSWLCAELRRSTDWADKAARTREDVERALAVLEPVFGPSQCRAITPALVQAFYARLRAGASLDKSARVMKWFRYVLGWGCRLHPREVPLNPTLAVKVKQPRARRQVWAPGWLPRAIRSAWRRRWYGCAWALALAYDTGLRPQDLRRLTPRGVRPDRVVLTPQKTAHLAGRDHDEDFPIWPETWALYQRYRAKLGVELLPDQPALRSVSGRPYASRHHLAKQIRQVLRDAGLPDTVQLRDLRRTGNVEAAIGGASGPQLAARLNQSIGRGQAILDVYAPGSFEARVAAQEARRASGPTGKQREARRPAGPTGKQQAARRTQQGRESE
jgi:integrase